MDYIQQGLIFKIRKTLRYVRLYGPARTFAKIKAQYHMRKTYSVLPLIDKNKLHDGHIGIIGCGNFAFSTIAYYVKKNNGLAIRAAMDTDINKAASLFGEYGLKYFTDNADDLINDPAIDLIYIASNHASHAEYAIKALEQNKSVHIEKPHVVNMGQLERLCQAMLVSKGKVSLGFNRPYSRIGQIIKQHLESESGPAMLNWFLAGHAIPEDHWYFKEEEGGRVLGNLCHWTDFVYQMVPEESRYPIVIKPTRWEKSDCDIAVTYIFGDGSIAAITFSAKGHTFEGVRERFSAHRGNTLISLDDFKDLTIEVVDRKYKPFILFRDHGHEEAIKRSYRLVRPTQGTSQGCSVGYIWESGELFLKTKQALEQDKVIIVHGFDKECLDPSSSATICPKNVCAG